METDLLVFGPHPDDIEIGIGGTVAKHAWRLVIRSACAISRGEMASNGTPDERLAEAEAARIVLGAAWRATWQIAPSAVTIRCGTLRD